VRVGVIAAIATIVELGAPEARAEPLEVSGFVGVGWFSDNTQLGNSWAPEQVPNTAPVLGARIGWVPVPSLVSFGDGPHVELAVEAELSLATAFTGGTQFEGDTGRMSYFAPVFGWRAHAAIRLAGGTVRPHLVVGVGGETIASSSPFMSKETDPVVYWGPGLAIPVSDRWLVRVDLRHGIMAARDSGISSTIELQLGVSTTFGPPVKRAPPPPIAEPDIAAIDDVDTDGDGIPDRLDLCPSEKETVNGIDDGDGCPEVDPDGDGIIGAADKCPDAAEDFDHFQDEDGCPELDNDNDGIDDARDVCPNEPETRNGIDDDDGCPDTVPDDVIKTLAAAATVKFELNRARITNPAKDQLQKLLAVLVARSDVKLSIAGHPEKAGGEDLAKRRAEAVKWYLVDQGIIEDRLETSVSSVGKPALELALIPH
jgi:OOP family OmpA-OmpF porin